MKGDFTRSTYDRKKHYNSVRMQQGRVQLDADWNEQLDISSHRIETGASDVIGCCGAPMHQDGFHLVSKISDLTDGEKARSENKNPGPLEPVGDFYITAGHFYLDGILCENEHIVPFTKQPDLYLPEAEPLKKKGTYLAYLDVWSRHVTALEDEDILEKALGGPDTATRTKTIWQVKYLEVADANVHCLSSMQGWDDMVTPPIPGKLAAQTEKAEGKEKPCIIKPGAGYRRLENQLYRVEVHKGGNRGKATFKWSRDNGSIVAAWESQDVNNLTVKNIGRDKVLSFATGQWVELTDDTHEFLNEPGTLVKLKKVEGNILTIDSSSIIDPDDPSATSVDRAKFPNNPKIRRWDSDGEIKPTNSNWIPLEDGVQVKFTNGTYKTGDYWLIPARTAEADVEWPIDENTNKRELQLPHGVRHHYCRMALISFDGTNISISDCRRIFPPVTELTSLFYVSGDGQEAMPGQLLPKPLQVGVANGQWPVAKTKVKFKRLGSGGALQAGSSVVVSAGVDEMVVSTDKEGIAECKWQLDSNILNLSQQVEAILLDAGGNPLHLPIRFTANLSIASSVGYNVPDCVGTYGDKEPTVHSLLKSTDNWPDIDKDGHSTVKDILDVLLCKLDASKIPFEVTKCSNSIFETKRQTIADALLSLCNMERLAGCAVTVGTKEQAAKYQSIQEAFSKEEGNDICLCLLPGNHIIKDDPDEKGRNSIKITGCGASIDVKSSRISLAAKKIMLCGTRFHMADKQGSLVLAGENVTAEHCEFSRKTGSQDSVPLVWINPLDEKQTTVHLRWKANKMDAWWTETIPEKAADYVMPVADIEFSRAARDRLVKLSKVNPYEKKEEFELALEMIANDIEKLTVANRVEWFERRSTRRINRLSQQPKSAVESLFKTISKESITDKVKLELRERLRAVFKAFYVRYYADALALTRRVGGWIEDNVINGYVSLQYAGVESSYLYWPTGQNDEEIVKRNGNKKKWVQGVMKGENYILVESTSLNLRGNGFYAVRSNAPSIMKIIDPILNAGEGKLEHLDLAYKSLTATDNIFHSNGNSFVSETVIMQGNQFSGATQEWAVAANVLGYSGVFTGNVAPEPNMRAVVECILSRNPMQAANFLRIENFP
jgi:hypothetical protein